VKNQPSRVQQPEKGGVQKPIEVRATVAGAKLGNREFREKNKTGGVKRGRVAHK